MTSAFWNNLSWRSSGALHSCLGSSAVEPGERSWEMSHQPSGLMGHTLASWAALPVEKAATPGGNLRSLAMTIGVWIAIVVVAVAVALVVTSFIVWRTREFRRLRSGSVVADTALGPVEYALQGSGPSVVVLHGGIGGWDQGLAISQDLGLDAQFTVLAPSRAGYLRTPLSTCRTPDQTAVAIEALLDDLNMDKVAVIGISGGGPTALALTLRLKDRVQALVMLAAITCRHEQPARTTSDGIVRLMFSDSANLVLDFVLWVFMVQLIRILPRYMVKRIFQATETFDKKGLERRVEEVMRHREQWTWMARLFESSLPLSVRKVGLDNDLKQFAALPVYPVKNITCPTLVVHGRHDGNVPFSHAAFVADNVPNAELFVAETCGHLIWMSDDAEPAREKVMSFLRTTLLGAV